MMTYLQVSLANISTFVKINSSFDNYGKAQARSLTK